MAIQDYIEKIPLTAEEAEDILIRNIWDIDLEQIPATAKEAVTILSIRCNYASRMPQLLYWLHWGMNHEEWIKTLGEVWTRCEKITKYIDKLLVDEGLLDYLGCGPIPFFMSEDEKAFYDSLPDKFTVYRGCYDANSDGLSWTLDKQKAEWFPFSRAYRREGQPILITAEVEKNNALAVKLGRGESEVVTYQPKIISRMNIVYKGV